MPPRRSTRNSLPTPANSTKAPSIASPSVSQSSKVPNVGLTTPTSMTEEGSPDPMALEEEEASVREEEDVKPRTRGVKRKSEPADSPFDIAPPSSVSTSPTLLQPKRTFLESVQIPVRRTSKLSTEKTASADNLTLGSPQSKQSSVANAVKVELSEAEVESVEEKPKARTVLSRQPNNGGRPEHQPFNVGKFSSVSKSSTKTLELDSDDSALDDDVEEAKPRKKPSKSRAAKSKGKGKKSIVESNESDYEDPADDDFAMDSDEEEKQLKAAIKASTRNGFDTPASSSSRASSQSAKGKGKASPAAKRNNSTALRAAVARAAEKRFKGTDTPMSLESGLPSPSVGADGDNTPSDDSGSEFGKDSASRNVDTPNGLSELSDVSDESEAGFSSDLSDVPNSKTKGKAKAKGKRRFGLSKGQRLDGVDVKEEVIDFDALSPEDRAITVDKIRERNRSERRRKEEALEPIRKKERALKKELGRKLTNGEKNLIRLQMHHDELQDVWGDLAATIEPVKPVTMEAHPSLKLTLLPFQKESLYWMKKQEEGPWKGGMLADEMGMGKTIQTIALLLSEPRRKPSLVLAPVVALMQWKHEIETHAEGFSVYLWHGSTRAKASDLKKYDVVLSSYGTVEAAFRRQQRGFKRGDVYIKEKSPVHEFEWFRVILDEAHNIKERSANVAKAAFALQAKYKWCLSGTPLQNRVGELYSLVRFLGADPFSHYFCKKCPCKSLHWQFKNKRTCDDCGHKPMDHVCFWNTEILTPIAKYGIESGNPGHTAFKKLKILLDRMMLRRTKLERADDLGLPPRIITVRRDYFSPAEKELYYSLFQEGKRQFATYLDQGTVLNNYSNIFSLITRMRQMACHPDLVLRSKTSKLMQDVSEGTVCRLCNDQAEDAIASACKHVFDRECIRQYLEVQQLRGHRPECPVCHIEISIDLEAEAIDLDDGGSKKARQGILSRLNLDNWRSSSKLEALVEELEKLRRQDCTIKSLVFSQFVSFLDLIAFRLQRAGFNICRLEGGMTPQQRDATIQHFMKNTEVTVFLISLKAGGVALNLTEASMVFMMDSWWNPSVEYQAMDRIHRLGQKRPVKVVKLVIEDSIEYQIVELQHKKLAMTEAALSTDPDAALGKLTVEDLGFLFKM